MLGKRFTEVNTMNTLRAETFAGRNFRDFRGFGPISRKLMPGKELENRFAKVIFAKQKFFKNRESFFQV